MPPGSLTCEISCYNCKAPFDALDAAWCSCIVHRRSFNCPSCLKCFCKAPQAFKQKFWEQAPQELWDRAGAQQARVVEQPPNPEDAESATRPLVLIVEDEADVRSLTQTAVQDLGYGVAVAGDGEEGLRLARRLKPDLVLTDAMMPKIDGREMCRSIKNDPSLLAARVVIMTSIYTASRYKYEAYREFHADGYLTKPLEFSDLQETLRKYLG